MQVERHTQTYTHKHAHTYAVLRYYLPKQTQANKKNNLQSAKVHTICAAYGSVCVLTARLPSEWVNSVHVGVNSRGPVLPVILESLVDLKPPRGPGAKKLNTLRQEFVGRLGVARTTWTVFFSEATVSFSLRPEGPLRVGTTENAGSFARRITPRFQTRPSRRNGCGGVPSHKLLVPVRFVCQLDRGTGWNVCSARTGCRDLLPKIPT